MVIESGVLDARTGIEDTTNSGQGIEGVNALLPRGSFSWSLSVFACTSMSIARKPAGLPMAVPSLPFGNNFNTIFLMSKVVDKAASVFLRNILVRMKEMEMNQTKLAARMKESCFAKAMQIDFIPVLTLMANHERRTESQASMG